MTQKKNKQWKRLGGQLLLTVAQGGVYFLALSMVFAPADFDSLEGENSSRLPESNVERLVIGSLSLAWAYSGVFLISSQVLERLEKLREKEEDKKNKEDDEPQNSTNSTTENISEENKKSRFTFDETFINVLEQTLQPVKLLFQMMTDKPDDQPGESFSRLKETKKQK
jgi:hypothetical protein